MIPWQLSCAQVWLETCAQVWLETVSPRKCFLYGRRKLAGAGLMDTRIIAADDPGALQVALEWLESGQLVAFPTDTVYGLGGMVFDERAIERIYKVKARRTSKAIPVLLGDMSDLLRLTDQMLPGARRMAAYFWPGPLTLVVPRHPALPENLSPGPTLGVRMPDHPLALELLRLAGPLAVSSANLSERPSASTAGDVFAQLGGRIPLIIDGGSAPGGVPSTVVDCSAELPHILRPGPITFEELMLRWVG